MAAVESMLADHRGAHERRTLLDGNRWRAHIRVILDAIQLPLDIKLILTVKTSGKFLLEIPVEGAYLLALNWLDAHCRPEIGWIGL